MYVCIFLNVYQMFYFYLHTPHTTIIRYYYTFCLFEYSYALITTTTKKTKHHQFKFISSSNYQGKENINMVISSPLFQLSKNDEGCGVL